MAIEERIERIKKLKEKLIEAQGALSKPPFVGSEFERITEINNEIKLINLQISRDQLKLARPEIEAEEAYCPVARKTFNKGYCEHKQGGERCESFDKCYE